MTILPDVNVLIYAHRSDSDQHATATGHLTAWLTNDQVMLPIVVATRFYRIVTDPRAVGATSAILAMRFLSDLSSEQNCSIIGISQSVWPVFQRLQAETGIVGSDSSDLLLAAIASDSSAVVGTFDRDFARFSSVPHLLLS
jgi:uncharacterized protein